MRISTTAAIFWAALLNIWVSSGFYFAHLLDPNFSVFSASFFRVLANFICLVIPWIIVGQKFPRLKNPRLHKTIWLWGFFGVLTSTTYFLAVQMEGGGRSSFLNASSGIFIAALAPLLAQQKVPFKDILGILGAISGMYLLSFGEIANPFSVGSLVAIASGLFAGLAYLMIARTRKNYPTTEIMLHWAVCNLSVYLLVMLFFPLHWPQGIWTYVVLISVGLAAAISQFFTAYAYQNTRASFIASLSYASPTLTLVIDALFFKFKFHPNVFWGAIIVLGFGVAWPLWRENKSQSA